MTPTHREIETYSMSYHAFCGRVSVPLLGDIISDLNRHDKLTQRNHRQHTKQDVDKQATLSISREQLVLSKN